LPFWYLEIEHFSIMWCEIRCYPIDYLFYW